MSLDPSSDSSSLVVFIVLVEVELDRRCLSSTREGRWDGEDIPGHERDKGAGGEPADQADSTTEYISD